MTTLHDEFKKILAQLQDLNLKVHELMEDNKILEAKNTKITKENGELQVELENTKEKCDADMTTLHDEFKKILAQLQDLNLKVHDLMEKNKILEETIAKLKKEKKDCEDQVKTI